MYFKQLFINVFFFSLNNFHIPKYLRLREQRKDLVASVDKKLPNGFLEDQGKFLAVLSIFTDYIFLTEEVREYVLLIIYFDMSSLNYENMSYSPYFCVNTYLSLLEQTVVLLPRSPSPSKRYFPIPLDSLEEEFRLRLADDGKLFREEFNVGS